MRFEQTRDVLDHVRRHYEETERFYHRLEKDTDKQRLKLLLDYLGKRQSDLQKALKRVEGDASKSVLETWFQYSHDMESLSCPEIRISEEMDVDDVMHAALHAQDCVVGLYRDIASTANVDEVKAIFENLARQSEQERQKLARNAQLLMDF